MKTTVSVEATKKNMESYYVETRPLIKYGPLTFSELSELYIYEVINCNTFCSLSDNNNNNANEHHPFRMNPNQKAVWKPIKHLNNVYSKLTSAMSSYSPHSMKRNSNVSNDSNGSRNGNGNNNNNIIAINMNVSGTTVKSMDINMNINSHDSDERHWSKRSRMKEVEMLKMKCSLQSEEITNLRKIRKDLEKEISSLNNKYSTKYIDFKTKINDNFEKYKKEKNDLLLKKNEKKNDEMERMVARQSELVDELAEMHLNMKYYESKYYALQSKMDSEQFNYDKYQSDFRILKQEIIHQKSVISHYDSLIDSLLKNTIAKRITNDNTNNTEGINNNDCVSKSSLIRLNAIQISELLTWHNYLKKFHICLDALNEYELASQRSRIRMRNVVSMLGEKVKALNINNMKQSHLISLSNDLKQSWESIQSEQHLKEYQLSNHKSQLLKMQMHNKRISSQHTPPNTLSPIRSAGNYSGNNARNDSHDYNVSFSSMVSLNLAHERSMIEKERNQSLHSISPSLDGHNGTISKHRKKSNTLKGSGLRLLTDQDTLDQYLNPKERIQKDKPPVFNKQISASASGAAAGHSIVVGKYSNYSAFKIRRNGSKRHMKKSSYSSNRSFYSVHRSRNNNYSQSSVSMLSVVDNELLDEDHSDVDDIDDDGASSVIIRCNTMPNHIPMFNAVPESGSDNDVEANTKQNADVTNVSPDILSFFAM